jgi:hypothetical protein
MARAQPWFVTLACAASLACGARSELRTTNDNPPDAAPPPEITPDFVWYKLDETSGETAHDSSPNHWNLSLSNVTWDEGAVFDGATVCGAVNVPENFRQPPVTIGAWLTPSARADQTSNAYGLAPFPPNAVSGDYPGSGGYGLGLDVWTDGDAGHAVSVETGIGSDQGFHSISGAFADGDRHFLALVIGSADATIFVDGKQTQQTTESIAPSVTPTPLHVGCHNDDDGYGTKRFYKGRMRDVRIYKRALGAGEIAQLFSNGPV